MNLVFEGGVESSFYSVENRFFSFAYYSKSFWRVIRVIASICTAMNAYNVNTYPKRKGKEILKYQLKKREATAVKLCRIMNWCKFSRIISSTVCNSIISF